MSEHNDYKDGLRVEVINLSYSLESNEQSSFPWEKQKNWKKKSIQLLSNISFIVEKGELCGLMGSSGAGKRYVLICFKYNLYMDIHTYIYTYIHAYMHAYIHITYIHTYIQTILTIHIYIHANMLCVV